ncbi:aspartate/glutamate racemase family protein [Oceanibium sediminis]|uniref:aspartate racemase/maleate isomerase family protein n=1 Tax=Oceanibium sediminis TaxID=2026339 RepID=UPI000DD3D520|nr:aspartate/glutamate racemase family protein [Oceanibium sediminis]
MTEKSDVLLSSVPVRLEPRDAVTRLGLIALATDLTTERDAANLLPRDHAALHVARIAFQNPTTPENLRRMLPRLTDTAALLLPDEPVAAIYYACTAASVAMGDDAVISAIQAAKPGVPVVTPTAAALAAFGALGIRKVALMTPYLPETTAPMADYFNRHGLDIVSAQCLGLEDDRDMARVSAQTIIDAAIAADRPEAEGVFLSCTGLPALGVIETLEARLGKPVISSNQAALWKLLSHAGLAPTARPGRIFTAMPPEQAA